MRDEDVMPDPRAAAGTGRRGLRRPVLDRFANPALRHRTTQVAMDGSQKLPLRLLGTVRDRLAAGPSPSRPPSASRRGWPTSPPARTGTVVPSRWTTRWRHGCARRPATGRDAAAVVDGLLGVTEVFGDDLRDSTAFRESLVGQVKGLLAESGRSG